MTQTPSEKQQKLKKLRNLYRSLKNKPEKLRTLLRVKALIAYYKGHACEVVVLGEPRITRSAPKRCEAGSKPSRRMNLWTMLRVVAVHQNYPATRPKNSKRP